MLTAEHKWSLNAVKVYYYRKTFGLSYDEFLEEPIDDYHANSTIMSVINELENKKNKKLERQAKRAKHGKH